MRHVELGNTGEMVSELCLGTMMFGDRCDEAESARILDAAVEHGINYIDTAAMYGGGGGTEAILGRIMGNRRKTLFLTTKVVKGIDADSILSSIDESLARLKTDHVDQYLIHWPVKGMNPYEIMKALNQVVQAGKTRYVGVCNFPAWLFAHCNAIALENNWAKLTCNQVAYNLIERGIEVEILPQAKAEKIVITTYRPVATGLLTGKYRMGQPMPANSRGAADSRLTTWVSQFGPSLERFIRYADKRGVSPGHLATAWVRYNPAVTCPIVGVSSLQQLIESFGAFEFDLTADEYDDVSAIFDTEVKEEGFQRFAGYKYNFPRLRRDIHLLD